MSAKDSQHSTSSLSDYSLLRYSCFNLLLLLLLGTWFWLQNRPVVLPEIKLAPAEKLQCVSYSPYYGKEQTPLVKSTHISHEQIDHDLSLLSQRFQCVRIYSVSQGLDYVPEAASKLGLKVMLGAWIGWVKADNDDELKLATSLANRYAGTVTALIVGNEVLLRGEQSEAAMRDYLNSAKQATKIPVTYADVWEFWLKHKSLEKSVDFITVHVLPYWEDDPQSIEHASAHTSAVMDKLAASFSKPLFIGETGWPTQGRQRAGSVPSQLNQTRYLREFIQLAQSKGWNYNLIEAIDQPWKRSLEGTVGGYWGLYSNELQPKFDLNTTQAERHDAWWPLFWASLGALALAGLAAAQGERRTYTLAATASLGALIAITTPLQLQYLTAACRNVTEWTALGGMVVTGWLALVGMHLVLTINSSSFDRSVLAKRVLSSSLLALVIGTAVAGWLQWSDGRYRDFPLVIYALPALQLSLGLWLAGIRITPGWRITYTCIFFIGSVIAVLTASVAAWREPGNLAALLWLGLTILFAMALWPSLISKSVLKTEKKN